MNKVIYVHLVAMVVVVAAKIQIHILRSLLTLFRNGGRRWAWLCPWHNGCLDCLICLIQIAEIIKTAQINLDRRLVCLNSDIKFA